METTGSHAVVTSVYKCDWFLDLTFGELFRNSIFNKMYKHLIVWHTESSSTFSEMLRTTIKTFKTFDLPRFLIILGLTKQWNRVK